MTVNLLDALRSKIPLQEGRFSHSPRISSRQEPHTLAAQDSETVYSVYKLPDGFRAVFDYGIFRHGDVTRLSDFHREQHPGKELKLVPLSELDGEVFDFNNRTGIKTPAPLEPTLYVLLVEDKEIPDGTLAKSIYFATQGLKETICPDRV